MNLAQIPSAIYVFIAFICVLGAYVALRVYADDAGSLDELLLLLGGGVAGVAVPRGTPPAA